MNKLLKSLLWTGAGAAALAAANNAIFAGADALTNTLGGEGRFWPGPQGDVFYAKQGQGTPVVLLHGIYAGASGWEWRKNFDALSEHYQVYAPDWLGFGLSDKPPIRYSAEGYVEQIGRYLETVVGEPAIVIGSSLAGAYAVQAAVEHPDRVRGLILVCPTGMRELSSAPGAKEDAAFAVLRSPLLGTSLYNGLVSKPSLRWYLANRTYFDPTLVDDAMIKHYSDASHQYGSQNALASFASAMLNVSVKDTFPKVTQSTLRLIWGREARTSPLSDAEAFLGANSRAELSVLDRCGGLPHDEQASAFNRLVVDIITHSLETASAHGA